MSTYALTHPNTNKPPNPKIPKPNPPKTPKQLPARRPAELSNRRLSRRHKSVSRVYGGQLSHSVVRERIVRAFLIEEQKIVKRVRFLSIVPPLPHLEKAALAALFFFFDGLG